ncbi:MAG: GNAT family N-acetyltransferase [Pseudomonadota bacterium]
MPEIRDARPADRPVIIRFMAALQDFERALEPHRADGAEMAEAHLTAMEAWLSAHPAGAQLVAEEEGRVVGWLLSGIEEPDGAMVPAFARQTGWIRDLWVEPEARGKGVARALIAAAEARFLAHGIRRIELAAVAGNTRAISLYRALGFADYELTLGKTL